MLIRTLGLVSLATAQSEPVADKGNGVQPQDEPLRCAFRPPQETPVQSAAMEAIYETAAKESAAARSWAVSYMGSQDVRSRLHKSLHQYSNEQLLQMFSWEFERLPIFHNAPLDSFGGTIGQVHDDSPLNVSLDNQYLQNVCQRYVLGGPESAFSVGLGYSSVFVDAFGLSPDMSATNGQQCVFMSSLRSSNDCLLYNANNLFKYSTGNNVDYGSVTYLLNRKTMRNRLFWEIWDGGLVNIMAKKDAKYGTVDPPAFYHLLQPHEKVWKDQATKSGVSYSIADVFNRWWVPGTPPPNAGPTVAATPYFEVMSTNVWLPEDLLAILMPYDDAWMQRIAGSDKPASYCDPSKMAQHPCFPYGSPRGRELGDALRNWTRAQRRPLIWGGTEKDPEPRMIMDPYVLSGIVWRGGHRRITQEDITRFEGFWSQGIKGPSFKEMAARMPAHLHLHWQTYNNRSACENEEKDPTSMILGTDGNGDCVYWSMPAPPAPPVVKYECLNDGTCSKSSSVRAIFSTETECKSSCAQAWECVSDVPHATNAGRKYCLPKLRVPTSEAEAMFPFEPLQARRSVYSDSSAEDGSKSFPDIQSCEAECEPDSPIPGFGIICWNFYILALVAILLIISISLCCCGLVAKFVAPQQEGDGGWSTPLYAVHADWEVCIIGTFCPCWLWATTAEFKEWRRPIGSYSTSERVLLCCTYVFLGLLVIRGGYVCFGCITRPSLRRRLGGIKGTCKQDMAIHCCAHFCALCQEAREIKMWNEQHLISGGPMVPLETTAPPALPVHTVWAGDEAIGARSSENDGNGASSSLRERLLSPPSVDREP